jgi:ribonuclease D
MFGQKDKTEDESPLTRKLSRDEINDLELTAYQGQIALVRTHEDMLRAISELDKETLLGFDTETRPVFQKGVSYPTSLLQLAGENRVYVFQLQFLSELDKLFALLANKDIIKAGVAIDGDMKDLQELSDFKPANLVDLGDCARKTKMKHHGLRGLTALLLGFRITKSGQKYNWSVPKLRNSAIKYAATDAWVGRELYLIMQERGCI